MKEWIWEKKKKNRMKLSELTKKWIVDVMEKQRVHIWFQINECIYEKLMD